MLGHACDVSTQEGRTSLQSFVHNNIGQCLDILINNVGTNIRKATTEYTDEEVDHVRWHAPAAMPLLTRCTDPQHEPAVVLPPHAHAARAAQARADRLCCPCWQRCWTPRHQIWRALRNDQGCYGAGELCLCVGQGCVLGKQGLSSVGHSELGMRVGERRHPCQLHCSLVRLLVFGPSRHVPLKVHQHAAGQAGARGPCIQGTCCWAYSLESVGLSLFLLVIRHDSDVKVVWERLRKWRRLPRSCACQPAAT